MTADVAPPPAGLVYREGFVGEEEAQALLADLEAVPFAAVRMHGVVAKRSVAHFGWDYGYDSWRIAPAPPIPAFLLSLRARCAAAAGCDAESFAEALITKYPAGAGIGWHRDAPMFGSIVAGVSLRAACVMRFRRGPSGAWERYAITLAPRSLYVLAGEARAAWQHGIAAAPDLRYSITFRQVRARPANGEPR